MIHSSKGPGLGVCRHSKTFNMLWSAIANRRTSRYSRVRTPTGHAKPPLLKRIPRHYDPSWLRRLRGTPSASPFLSWIFGIAAGLSASSCWSIISLCTLSPRTSLMRQATLQIFTPGCDRIIPTMAGLALRCPLSPPSLGLLVLLVPSRLTTLLAMIFCLSRSCTDVLPWPELSSHTFRFCCRYHSQMYATAQNVCMQYMLGCLSSLLAAVLLCCAFVSSLLLLHRCALIFDMCYTST